MLERLAIPASRFHDRSPRTPTATPFRPWTRPRTRKPGSAGPTPNTELRFYGETEIQSQLSLRVPTCGGFVKRLVARTGGTLRGFHMGEA